MANQRPPMPPEPPPEPTPPKDAVERSMSHANRIDIPYEFPAAAFLRASDREQQAKQARRLENSINPGGYPEHDEQAWQQRIRDENVERNYRHHYTDMRGTLTAKKWNIWWRKPGSK